MVYMGADNTLSSQGLDDLNEMEAVGSSDDVNIVVQAEFSRQYSNFDAAGYPDYQGDTLRLRVEKDDDPDKADLDGGVSIGNVNMASPATLAAFIEWAAETYPAEHYALVIWDHGAGWKATGRVRGAVEDATSDTWMSLPDLARGVMNSGVSFDVIDFDACLMAMYEVAYEFFGLSDYLVFSEEVEPGPGNPYDTILKALDDRPGMDGADLSKTIVDAFAAYYADHDRVEKITKSAVDMAQIDALHTSVLQFAEVLVSHYGQVGGAVESARANSQHYEYTTNLDLYDFARRIHGQMPDGSVKDRARAVMDAVQSAVIANQAVGGPVADSHGLAIYVPAENQVSDDQIQDDLKAYARLACNLDRSTRWLHLVETMTKQQVSTILVPGGFRFFIEWDTDADLDLYVCEPDSDFCYAPHHGQSTANGFFSGDSADTGFSEEYYSANDYVNPGDYNVFIWYWDDGPSNDFANVTFWVLDGDATGGEWQSYGPVQLDLSNEGVYDDIPTYEALNDFSNFWYPWWASRAFSQLGGVSVNSVSATIKPTVLKIRKGRPTPK
jgi:hypothetical protein